MPPPPNLDLYPPEDRKRIYEEHRLLEMKLEHRYAMLLLFAFTAAVWGVAGLGGFFAWMLINGLLRVR
jgi:hypothetical protein